GCRSRRGSRAGTAAPRAAESSLPRETQDAGREKQDVTYSSTPPESRATPTPPPSDNPTSAANSPGASSPSQDSSRAPAPLPYCSPRALTTEPPLPRAP